MTEEDEEVAQEDVVQEEDEDFIEKDGVLF
jgi:hypothetical protein